MNEPANLASWTDIIDAVVDKSEFGSIVLDSDRKVLIWNQKMVAYSGISRENALGRSMESFFNKDLPIRLKSSVEQAIKAGMSSVLSYKFHGQVLKLSNRDGDPLLFTTYIKPISLPLQNSDRYCLIEIHDMTNVEAREKRLHTLMTEHQEGETRLRLLTDNLPAVIHQVSITDSGDKEVTFLSRGVESLLSEEFESLCDRPDFLTRYILPDDLEKFNTVLRDVTENVAERDIVVQIRLPNKQKKWVHAFLRSRKRRNGTIIIDGLYLDITYVKIGEEELKRLATTDSLTGIFNRRHLLDVANRDLSIARRYNTPLSVLLIDIDHFKSVNDNHGHDVGDTVLVNFAQLTKSILRETDTFGRLGGEEFVVILPQTAHPGAYSVAEKIRSTTEIADLSVEGLNITVSIGLCEILPSDQDISVALKRADIAVYKAKDTGRNKTSTYSETDGPSSSTD